MSGYQRCLSIRQLNTSSTLLNAVATHRTSTAPSSSTFIRANPGRRILSEDDRRRTSSLHRRTNAFNERFQKVRDERRLLIERHRNAIETNEAKDLSSIVETIEFNSYTTHAQLDDILYLLENKPESFDALNDRQLSILIQAGGAMAQYVSPKFRQKYVEKLWQFVSQKKDNLGIFSYNARIQANIENEVEQNVVEVLKELSAAGIDADENTFSLLAKMYALKGQTAGILNIIELLKEQNLPATQPLFESLVYSFAYNKEDDKVKTICQSLAANPAINVSLLYISAALAKAQATKDIDEVLKIFVDIPTSINFDKRTHLSKVLEIIVVLLENGVKDVVPKLQHYLYFDNARGTIPYSVYAERAAFKLFKNGNEAGALELFPVLDFNTKKRLRELFDQQLRQSVFNPPEKIVALAEIFRDGKVFSKPLARVVEYAYFQNLSIFPFYQKFIESPEFKEFEDRPHLFYPLILNLCSQISALKVDNPKRPQLLAQLLELLSKYPVPDQVARKTHAIIAPEAEDVERLTHLIKNNPNSSFAITSIIAENMLYNNQLEKLEALLDGPLLNQKVLLIRVLPVIIRSLNRPGDLPESDIRTVAKVIAAGFTDNRTGGTHDFGYRVIQEIFKNKGISEQRLSTLVRFLNETPKVSLSKDEIQKICSELHGGNNASRIEILKQLQSKSKAVQRWLSSSFENLEKEAAFLDNAEDVKPGIKARIYVIMIKKLVDDRAANHGKKILEIMQKYKSLELEEDKLDLYDHIFPALRRCLLNGDLESAKEFWGMRKDHYDELKLLYSLCLFDKGENEEAKIVLASMRHAPQHSNLVQAIESNAASLQTIENFIELVGTHFCLPQHSRKQAKRTIKQMELRRAIGEDDLEKAFSIVSKYAATNNEVFGQLDLMSACITKGNKAMLTQIFEMVAERYDRNTASIDLMVSFLECGSFQSAEQVYKKAKNIFLSNAKTEFLIDREKKLKKPDVLHKLFLICTDPDSLAPSDAQVMLKECMDLYGKLENLDGLKQLQNDIEKARFVDDFQKMKAHLDALISTVGSKNDANANARRRSASSTTTTSRSMSRNNSIFEHHDGKPTSEAATTST